MVSFLFWSHDVQSHIYNFQEKTDDCTLYRFYFYINIIQLKSLSVGWMLRVMVQVSNMSDHNISSEHAIFHWCQQQGNFTLSISKHWYQIVHTSLSGFCCTWRLTALQKISLKLCPVRIMAKTTLFQIHHSNSSELLTAEKQPYTNFCMMNTILNKSLNNNFSLM
jgi:hypothetical protein